MRDVLLMAREFWAISGLGWGRGDSVEEAVRQHDEIQQRNYAGMLAVPIAEVPLTVYEAPMGATGFWLDGSVLHWTDAADHDLAVNPENELRAWRLPLEHQTEWAQEKGLEVAVL